MSASRRGLLLMVVVIVVVLIAFAWLVDLRAVVAQVRAASGSRLAAAAGMLLAGLAIYALRWRWLLGNGLGWWPVFHAANVGHAANILLPLRAGEAARVVALARGGASSASRAASSVVVERLLEQIMRLAALGGAVVFGVGLAVSPLTVAGAAAFLAAAFVFIVWLRRRRAWVLERAPRLLGRLPRLNPDRVRTALGGLLDGLEAAATPSRLAAAMLLSVLAWACFWAFHALALTALPLHFTPRQVLTLSLGALALATPSAPTQPGLYHASVVAPLGVLGFSETVLTAYAVLLHAVMMACMLGLGALGLALTGRPHQAAAPGPSPVGKRGPQGRGGAGPEADHLAG